MYVKAFDVYFPCLLLFCLPLRSSHIKIVYESHSLARVIYDRLPCMCLSLTAWLYSSMSALSAAGEGKPEIASYDEEGKKGVEVVGVQF